MTQKNLIERAQHYLLDNNVAEFNALRQNPEIEIPDAAFDITLMEGSLPKIDLSGCNLDSFRCYEVNFSDANLTNTVFCKNSLFDQCNLSGADLAGAYFRQCDGLENNTLDASEGIIWIPSPEGKTRDICKGILLSDHSQTDGTVYLKTVWGPEVSYVTRKIHSWLALKSPPETSIISRTERYWADLDGLVQGDFNQAALLPMLVSGIEQAIVLSQADPNRWGSAPAALDMIRNEWQTTYPEYFTPALRS